MLPLPDRILAALALQPMTVAQLARCLCTSRSTVYRHVRTLRYTREVRYAGRRQRGHGRPFETFEVAA